MRSRDIAGSGRGWAALAFACVLVSAAAADAPATTDPGWIAYSAGESGSACEADYSVFLERPDGSERRKLTSPNCPLDEPTNELDPALSADGRLVAFVDGNSQLRVVNSDGSGGRTLDGGNPDDNPYEPAFSPDGRSIVYMVDTRPITSSIRLVATDGQTAAREILTNARSGRFGHPSFLPSGRRILYVRYERRRSAAVTSRLDGTRTRRIVAGSRVLDWPAVSPNGKHIVFTLSRDHFARRDLYVRRLDGGRVRRLTRTRSFSETAPSFSPDGRTIVFQRDPAARGFSDESDIYLIDRTGDDLSPVNEDPGPQFSPDWGGGA